MQQLFAYLNGDDSRITAFSGDIHLQDGLVVNSQEFTLINSRSVAEDLVFHQAGVPIDGTVVVVEGLGGNVEAALVRLGIISMFSG